jgi:hypothetical protein
MPPVMQVVIQRHMNDCAVACLAMLLGLSYEEVLVAFRHNVIVQGAKTRHIQHAAKRLGHRLRWQRYYSVDEGDTGLLAMDSDRWRMHHLAVLKDGLIFDTDASVWDQDVYLATHKARTLSLLVLEGG